jgi:hypothetical protein
MYQFQIANLGALIAISMSMFSYQKLLSCFLKNNNILTGDLKQNGTKPLCRHLYIIVPGFLASCLSWVLHSLTHK